MTKRIQIFCSLAIFAYFFSFLEEDDNKNIYTPTEFDLKDVQDESQYVLLDYTFHNQHPNKSSKKLFCHKLTEMIYVNKEFLLYNKYPGRENMLNCCVYIL